MAGQVFTYVLRAPLTGIPIYVGKGSRDRVHKHRYQSSAIGAHVRDLRARGLKPSFERISVKSADEAFELESLLINEIGRRDDNTGSLFNLRPGGRKVLHSAASRRKMAEARIGKPLSEAHKRSISQTLSGRRPSDSQREKHSTVMKMWWASRKSHQQGVT